MAKQPIVTKNHYPDRDQNLRHMNTPYIEMKDKKFGCTCGEIIGTECLDVKSQQWKCGGCSKEWIIIQNCCNEDYFLIMKMYKYENYAFLCNVCRRKTMIMECCDKLGRFIGTTKDRFYTCSQCDTISIVCKCYKLKPMLDGKIHCETEKCNNVMAICQKCGEIKENEEGEEEIRCGECWDEEETENDDKH